MKEIVVISLFDGLSGARVALDRVNGLKVLRYYSSEIDKYAIKIANKNYPQDDKYRIGSVTEIDTTELINEIKQDFGDVDITKSLYRKLTPLECERLQTLPDNYTNCVSNARRFHATGNGFTVDVISHICESIVTDKTIPIQKTLF